MRTAILLLALLLPAAAAAVPAAIGANDNRTPAGALQDASLSLELRVSAGAWQAENALPSWTLLAFAEGDKPATAPGPLIRVPRGTLVTVSLRNDTDDELWIYGLCARPGVDTPVHLLPRGSAHARFRADTAGTFFYWGTLGQPLAQREGRDSELTGALVVDAPGDTPQDRIFVVGRHGSADEGGDGVGAWTINGHSWPQTERLNYRVGERVAWRWINATGHTHPMHLHGAYFRVTSDGDNATDTPRPASAQNDVVTQLLPPGGTMAVAWTPRQPGNWLFHCHILLHVMPDNRLPVPQWYDEYARLPHDEHMAGLVLGIHVGEAGAARRVPSQATRQVALRAAPRKGVGLDAYFGFPMPLLGYAVDGAEVSSPGATLVLERGRPVAVAIRNDLAQATSVHWHGIELESSYDDGVPHWGVDGGRVTPWIEPGGSFVAHFTPPRAGTFIYHTHFNDYMQLTAGLYGALIVVEPGTRLDPAVDHVFVIGQGPDDVNDPILVNGVVAVPAMTWRSGRHRIRLIGITAVSSVHAALLRDDAALAWRPLAKDGARLPATVATLQRAEADLSAGETWDFEFSAVAPAALQLAIALRDGSQPATVVPVDVVP